MRRPAISGRRSRASLDQDGSAAAELALVVPALVLVLGLLIAGGRLWFARTTVVEAAQTSARAASLARTAAEAADRGADAGRQSLSTAGLRCADTSVRVSTAAFSVPVGSPATVGSDVSCRVALADLGLPGLPGAVEIHAQGAAALDTYRSRGGAQ